MKPLFAGVSLALLALVACSPAPAPDAAAPAATIASAEIAAPAPVAIASPAGDYASDPNHSSVTFKLQHLGLSFYTLKFRTYDAIVSFDPANIAASKVTATIKPDDILAGYPSNYVANHPGTKFKSWEEDLANSTNFLDAKQFPTITFTSTSVAPSGERSAKVTGDLTLKGVTKPITLDVTFDGEMASHPFSKVPALGFSATGTFKRTDFGIDYLAGMVGDEVSVQIEGDFIQKKPS
ncbi:MAG: YceI family protein [Hyphomonadaceae bacterium]